MHEAGAQPVEQLALGEDDLGLVARALRHVAKAVDRLAQPDEVDEQLRAAPEQIAADGERDRQRQCSDQDARDFLSSAVMAGTISVRSPITA
jgi:hypothetical protein